MRRNLRILSILDLSAIAAFSAGYWIDSAPLMGVGLALFVAGLVFGLVRFRCPFCHRFVGIAGYLPGRFCSHCGALLEEDEGD